MPAFGLWFFKTSFQIYKKLDVVCPGRFVSWTFCNWMFGNWTFCILDVLYPGRSVTGRLVTGRFVTERYVTGRSVGVCWECSTEDAKKDPLPQCWNFRTITETLKTLTKHKLRKTWGKVCREQSYSNLEK
jgi:hypothetical protein